MQSDSTPLASQFANREQQRLAGTLGLWVFLATEVLFFGPLFFGYLYIRTHFPEAAGAASRHTDVLLGTLNTAVLLTSSLSMALAGLARQAGMARRCAWFLWLTAALGVLFIVIKGIEYHKEFAEHLFPAVGFAPEGVGSAALAHGMQLFFFLYFAMTALHALHLAIGITLSVLLALALEHGSLQAASEDKVELAGLYWHFVDVIWIFLYPLLYLVDRAGG